MNPAPGWSLEFHVPVDPGMAKQSRIVTRGRGGVVLPYPRKYTPTETENFRDAVARAAERACDKQELALPGPGPVLLSFTAVFLLGQSQWRKRQPVRRRWRTKKPDCDNISKPLLDALTGLLWLDDSQVMLGPCVTLNGAQGEPAGLWVRVQDLSLVEVPAGPVELVVPQLEREQPGLFEMGVGR